MEELLDDGEIRSTALAPVQKELTRFRFWLQLSGVLLVIIGLLGALFSFQIIIDGPSYNWLPIFLFSLGFFGAFLLFLPMAYSHFLYLKHAKSYCIEADDKVFEKMAAASVRDWRLVAIAFLFSGFGTCQLFIYETYKDIRVEYTDEYRETEAVEGTEEWEEPDDQPWEEVPEEPLEEDPAPPSD